LHVIEISSATRGSATVRFALIPSGELIEIVTGVSALTLVVVTLKMVLVLPELIEMLAGTLATVGLLLVSLRFSPLSEAGPVSAIVARTDPPPEVVAEDNVSDRGTGARSVNFADLESVAEVEAVMAKLVS